MTFLFALADYLSDPWMLALWCGIAWAFALTWFPWEPKVKKPVQIKVPPVRDSPERRWMAIREARSQ